MRVAHIITRMIIGGAQENTLYNCQDLIHQHHDDVLLITGPALGPEGNLLKDGRGDDIPTVVIDELRRAIDPALDRRSYRAIKQQLTEFRPDVVHTHSAKGGFLGRLAASRLRIPAIVHTVHGAPFHPYQGRAARELFRWCEWYAARRCHSIISVADAMTELMVSARVAPRDKFHTIYSGMDVEPFLQANVHRERMRSQLGFRPEHIVIGKIARLFHLKGHEYLIEIAKSLVEQNPNVRFLLVGDGILRADYERQIADLGLEDYFHFAGLVHPSHIPAMVSAMDLLVHVSLREGLARALPQALLAGKPVVSFDVDGAREVCLTDQTGILVPPRDTVALESALVRLAGDEELRRQLGLQGRELCQQRFPHQEMTRQIRQLYEQLLESNGHQQPSTESP